MLTPEELASAEKWYGRLNEPDASQVRRVVQSVDTVANSYFSSRDMQRNYHSFCEGNIFSGIKKIGTPFFAVYIIGGYLNKEGERPDIDLLVATNMRWSKGFFQPKQYNGPGIEYDPLWSELNQKFQEGFSLELEGELPTDYNLGNTYGKALIRIHPSQGKKIDLCYVRSWDEEKYRFISEEQFIEKDVGKAGEQLSRLPLYRASSSVEVPPWK